MLSSYAIPAYHWKIILFSDIHSFHLRGLQFESENVRVIKYGMINWWWFYDDDHNTSHFVHQKTILYYYCHNKYYSHDLWMTKSGRYWVGNAVTSFQRAVWGIEDNKHEQQKVFQMMFRSRNKLFTAQAIRHTACR